LDFLPNLSWAYKTQTSVGQVTLTRKIRFLLRSLFFYKASRAWYDYLKTSHLSAHPRALNDLIQQVHRPFYDCRITAFKKVLLLMNHHTCQLKLLGDKKTFALLDKGKSEICTITSKNHEKYKITLEQKEQFNKEGSLSLSLLSNAQTVMSLIFSFNEEVGHKRVLIGCVQATANETAEKLRHISHEFYGIQPRILLVNVLRLLCAEMDIKEIEAIGAANHIYQSFRYRRKKKIVVPYDALWELLGGTKKANGNYEIPTAIPHKPIESYPSKKRSEHRHRNALLETIKMQLQHFMTT
jgi:uncharacterized protein VirK/YbjX